MLEDCDMALATQIVGPHPIKRKYTNLHSINIINMHVHKRSVTVTVVSSSNNHIHETCLDDPCITDPDRARFGMDKHKLRVC